MSQKNLSLNIKSGINFDRGADELKLKKINEKAIKTDAKSSRHTKQKSVRNMNDEITDWIKDYIKDANNDLNFQYDQMCKDSGNIPKVAQDQEGSLQWNFFKQKNWKQFMKSSYIEDAYKYFMNQKKKMGLDEINKKKTMKDLDSPSNSSFARNANKQVSGSMSLTRKNASQDASPSLANLDKSVSQSFVNP